MVTQAKKSFRIMRYEILIGNRLDYLFREWVFTVYLLPAHNIFIICALQIACKQFIAYGSHYFLYLRTAYSQTIDNPQNTANLASRSLLYFGRKLGVQFMCKKC